MLFLFLFLLSFVFGLLFVLHHLQAADGVGFFYLLLEDVLDAHLVLAGGFEFMGFTGGFLGEELEGVEFDEGGGGVGQFGVGEAGLVFLLGVSAFVERAAHGCYIQI